MDKEISVLCNEINIHGNRCKFPKDFCSTQRSHAYSWSDASHSVSSAQWGKLRQIHYEKSYEGRLNKALLSLVDLYVEQHENCNVTLEYKDLL